MKRFLPLLILTGYAIGQEWMQIYDGGNADVGFSVQQTTDGGYIIAGWTSSFGNGGIDIWLVKTDSNGNE